MSETWVVLGSNSFSGATLVQVLLERGERVISISRSLQNPLPLLPYGWLPLELQKQNRFYQFDLNHHTADILECIQGHEAQYVVNFAAQSMVAESWLHPDQWYQTNVVANVRLHEGLRRFPFLKKYVHVTTPEVYGSCAGNVVESQPFNPTTPYAASRAACDLHLMTFFKQYQFPVCFTRAANVFGPGQPLYRIIPRCVYFFSTGRRLQLHGGGHSVRSFIHMRDVAEGTIRVAQYSPIGECYHFSTDRYLPIRDVVGIVASQVGVSFEDVVETVGERPGKDAAYLLDSKKAERQLGWKAEVSLEEGIAETISWSRRFAPELEFLPKEYIHKA